MKNPRTNQRTNMNALMVFTPIIMGGLNLKICQNFVGTKFFLTFVGDKPLWGELKLYWGSNICYYTFIISFI